MTPKDREFVEKRTDPASPRADAERRRWKRERSRRERMSPELFEWVQALERRLGHPIGRQQSREDAALFCTTHQAWKCEENHS